MEELNFISEYDRRILRSIIEKEKKALSVPPRTPPPYPLQLPQTPDIYIAFTPPGGISALTQGDDTGTGTGSGLGLQDDVPGSAYCDIYRLLGEGSAARFSPYRSSKLVYNLSQSAVPGFKWRQVNRSKSGHWLIVGDSANAGGCGSLSFPIYRYRCEADGTGTASYVLNEYRIYITITFDADGCLTQSEGAEVFVRAVACCDSSCAGGIIIDTGAGTTTVNCCGNALQQTLTLTVTNAACPAASATISLIWNSSTSKWEGSGDEGTCLNNTYTLECQGTMPTEFVFTRNGNTINIDLAETASCSPLALYYAFVSSFGGECGCPGLSTFKYVITE